jgi:hypothetical protein
VDLEINRFSDILSNNILATNRFYLLIGDLETWEISLKNRIWGFKETTKGLWNKLQIGEYVGFYATKPLKKIIGFGKILNKYIEETIVWLDEKFFNKSLWKYRMRLEIMYVVNNWNDGIDIPLMNLNTGRKVVSEDIFMALVKKADKKWKSNIYQQIIQKSK